MIVANAIFPYIKHAILTHTHIYNVYNSEVKSLESYHGVGLSILSDIKKHRGKSNEGISKLQVMPDF